MVISLERGADLHMAQLMPLPLTVSRFSKTQIGFTFLVPAYPGSPGQRAVKWVCVCCVLHWSSRCIDLIDMDIYEPLTLIVGRYSEGVSSPHRHVKTRLYFTSESHIHSLLTVLRYGGLCSVSQ